MLSMASIPGPSGKVYLLVGLRERAYSVYQEVSGFREGFKQRCHESMTTAMMMPLGEMHNHTQSFGCPRDTFSYPPHLKFTTVVEEEGSHSPP